MRFKATRTTVIEYEVDPANYFGTEDSDEMLRIDLSEVEKDPSSFFDDRGNTNVTIERIE